jgi:hypothetical protein
MELRFRDIRKKAKDMLTEMQANGRFVILPALQCGFSVRADVE